MTPAQKKSRIDLHLVRSRETLVLLGDVHPLIDELDLHILSCGLSYDPFVRQLIADGLTAMAFHLASRPLDEHLGWTISIQEPAVNLFFTGNAQHATVAARAFVDGVEPRADNVFIEQRKRGSSGYRQSSVAVEGFDVFAMVERFYTQSEQTPARFLHWDERTAFVLALPGADADWIADLSPDGAFRAPDAEDVELLGRRQILFRCGCHRDKIAEVLVGVYGDHPEALFGEEETVRVECPRCGAEYVVDREGYEASRSGGSTTEPS